MRLKIWFSLPLSVVIALTLLATSALALDESKIIYIGTQEEYSELLDNCFPEGLARVVKDGKYGYSDKSGKLVIPMIYDSANAFCEGLAFVVKDGKAGYIDKSGKIVIPMIYDVAFDFCDGLARVENDGKYGYINKSGKLVIPMIYDDARDFFEGLASVSKDRKQGIIDKSGKLVIPMIYDAASYFSEGLIIVGKDGKYGFIDKSGKLVIPMTYDHVYCFNDDLALVELNRKYGYIDKSGKLVIPVIYDHACSFYDGLARVVKDGKYGYIDKSGKLVIPMTYDGASDFYNDLAIVENDRKYGYIDKSGKLVIPMIYDSAYDFHSGLASVESDGKYGYIDKSGKLVISVDNYDGWGDFQGNLAPVENDRKYGLIDRSGKLVVPIIYDEYRSCGDLTVPFPTIRKDNKLSVFHWQGNFLFSIDFMNDGEHAKWSYAPLVHNGKLGYINAKYLDELPVVTSKTAMPTESKVLVNGKTVAFDAYTIDQNNYFKLRDLALALKGSSKQFQVTYDGAKNDISLICNTAYTPVGGELGKGSGKTMTAQQSTATIYLDGKECSMTAYTIGDNNYFKLRDVMQALDVSVGWDVNSNTIIIDTQTGYSPNNTRLGSSAN